MTIACICCANGNDLPEGEYCRACGRGVERLLKAVVDSPALSEQSNAVVVSGKLWRRIMDALGMNFWGHNFSNFKSCERICWACGYVIDRDSTEREVKRWIKTEEDCELHCGGAWHKHKRVALSRSLTDNQEAAT